ncbi:MAG: ComEC/Rec2 family competence protein, partial [Myxococcota bacterium]
FGLLVRGLASLPRPPRDPRRAAALGAALGSLAFALLAGGAPSAWRAALLMAAGLGLRALRRRPRPSALLALAALLFALAAPKEVPGPAFLLSLVATLALLGVPPGHGPLRAAFEASARTLVATAPLVLWIFGGVPLLGLLANVAVVPVAVALLVPLAFAHLLAATLGVGALTGALFEALSAALAAWAELFAAPELGMALPPPDLAQGVLLCLLCLVLLLARGPRRVVLALLLFAGLAGAEAHLRWREQPRTLRVTFLDVGQGDAALVDLPEGALLLVDAGTAPAGQDVIAPLLRARRRSTIDLAIVSHAHPDHIGGLAKLGVPIRELWWPGQARAETPDAEASRVVAALAASGTVVRESSALCAASRGRHRRSGALLEVLWPCPSWDPGYDLNDNSLVVRLEAPGAARVLFAGDVESLAEAELVAGHHAGRLSLRADVLKVPHHGSRTSSGLAFLRAVRPQAAVGSQARFHRFGHPHAEVRGRYEAEEIALFLTARDGGVTLRERRLEGAALGRRAGTMLRIPRAAEALSGNRRRRAPRPRRLRPGASGSRSPRSPRPPRPARRARGARNPRRTAHSPRPRPA